MRGFACLTSSTKRHVLVACVGASDLSPAAAPPAAPRGPVPFPQAPGSTPRKPALGAARVTVGVHPVTHCGVPSEPLWTPFSTLGLWDVTRPRRQACWPLAPARCSPASSLGLALGQQPCAPPGRGQSGVPRPDGLSPKPEAGLTQHHAVVCMAGACSELCRDGSRSQSLEKRQHGG